MGDEQSKQLTKKTTFKSVREEKEWQNQTHAIQSITGNESIIVDMFGLDELVPLFGPRI